MSIVEQTNPKAGRKTDGAASLVDPKASSSQDTTPAKSTTRRPASQKTKARDGKKPQPNRKPGTAAASRSEAASARYPRHSIEKALRIPKAVLEQNAGKECTDEQAAEFAKLKLHGQNVVEISSAIKYGLFERPKPGHLKLTDLARRILRPQKKEDEIEGLRAAVQKAPVFGEVYSHYRGENLPDSTFFANAIVDTFGVPQGKAAEFESILMDSLKYANLIEGSNGKTRVLDVSHSATESPDNKEILERLGKKAAVSSGDTCFVMMPFKSPHGEYYAQIYQKAIEKAGLTPVRADAELFGTGKIIDQVWRGINDSKVLVAELTTRNPNVFYELGLAHALRKPVVLISGNSEDVPFDLRHIRVIYYDTNDPFWGQKLLDKVAENILSAINNPEEAVFDKALTGGARPALP
ncbi:MAG: hypothetical protein HUU19_13110 [Phycisphaerales bacterium]|nr:hypothetical protein [Phycisphaerales bacterium]